MARRELKGFYFITDSRLSENGIIEDVRQALAAGAAIVQYREKDAAKETRLSEAKEIQEMCRQAGVTFIINDDVELAKEIGADGVHVGREDMPASDSRRILGPEFIIGVSAETVEEVKKAERDGADYLAVSPVFFTPSKPEAGKGGGIQGVRELRKATRLPLAAIGGLNRDNIHEVMEAGADMVCAISASLKNGTVEENIRKLMGE